MYHSYLLVTVFKVFVYTGLLFSILYLLKALTNLFTILKGLKFNK